MAIERKNEGVANANKSLHISAGFLTLGQFNFEMLKERVYEQSLQTCDVEDVW